MQFAGNFAGSSPGKLTPVVLFASIWAHIQASSLPMPSQTIGAVLRLYLGDPLDDAFLVWPPDVFAVAAILLKLSGGYVHAVNKWPPGVPTHFKKIRQEGVHKWNAFLCQIGNDWKQAVEKNAPAPEQIRKWWSLLRKKEKKDIAKLFDDVATCSILLQLLAAADEACRDIGIPDPKDWLKPVSKLEWFAKFLLQTQAAAGEPCTLCKRIPASLLAVVPKLHTPKSGATLRSLTHNLALHENVEISVHWSQITTALDHTINVLCVPWPLDVNPVDFCKAEQNEIELKNMRPSVRFFDYEPPKQAGFVKQFEELLRHALEKVGTVDGVVFPELAMDLKTFKQIRAILNKHIPASFLIAGVRSPRRNDSYCSIPAASDVRHKGLTEVREWQGKHHRWKLNRAQIEQYGLGGRLDAECTWWESTLVERRKMNFFSLQPWLTMGVLICEDLARQDPVGDLIRAVGPNLVVALLMDGPQLASRWPARYATVLADDPGSSVLTLSSLGMVLLSKPFDKPTSRVVGLWKDYTSRDAVEIELPPRKKGVVLSLTRQLREEFSADGRSDEKSTAYLILTGMRPI